VPKDQKLSGEKEVFTITVTYQTQELYGKVEAWRRCVISAK